MNKKIILSSSLAVLLIIPTLIFAQPVPTLPGTYTGSIWGLIQIVLDILWKIAVAFFIIMFILAGFMFATAQGDAEKVKTARGAVIWGAVGIVVALLAFSIVQILKVTIGV